MIITSIQVLKADEGKVLVKDGVYSSSVMLSFDDNPADWSEITQAEYDEIRASQDIEPY